MRHLILVLAIQISGFIKHRTVRHKTCKEENDIKKGDIGNCHTGCVIEYGEKCCSETKQYQTFNFPDFPLVF